MLSARNTCLKTVVHCRLASADSICCRKLLFAGAPSIWVWKLTTSGVGMYSMVFTDVDHLVLKWDYLLYSKFSKIKPAQPAAANTEYFKLPPLKITANNMNETKTAELGAYLYLAMGVTGGHKVVMAVGYTPEYADKKAKQFEQASNGAVQYTDISVIKTGQKKKCHTIDRYN